MSVRSIACQGALSSVRSAACLEAATANVIVSEWLRWSASCAANERAFAREPFGTMRLVVSFFRLLGRCLKQSRKLQARTYDRALERVALIFESMAVKVPARAFHNVLSLSPLFNQLVDAVSRDTEWLHSTLEACLGVPTVHLREGQPQKK